MRILEVFIALALIFNGALWLLTELLIRLTAAN